MDGINRLGDDVSDCTGSSAVLAAESDRGEVELVEPRMDWCLVCVK